MILTLLAFVLQKLIGFRTDDIIEQNIGLSYNGLFLHGRLWQLVTYMFLHGDFFHILMNMFLLFIFGRELEPVLRTERFLWLYIGCGVLAGMGWIIISGSRAGDVPCIGASGAAFGVAAAFAALNPRRELTLIIFPIPVPVTMRALTMVLIFGVVSLGLLLFQEERSIAHAAHLAGGVAGYVYGRRARRPVRKSAKWKASPREPEAWPEDEKLIFLEEGQEPETFDPREIDRILEKIQDKGMQSLTRHERKYLEDASRLDEK